MAVVATDPMAGYTEALDSDFEHAALVTPSDTDELQSVTRGVSLAVAGALAVVTFGGESLTVPSGALAAGQIHRLRVRQVKSTGTTATGVVAYW